MWNHSSSALRKPKMLQNSLGLFFRLMNKLKKAILELKIAKVFFYLRICGPIVKIFPGNHFIISNIQIKVTIGIYTIKRFWWRPIIIKIWSMITLCFILVHIIFHLALGVISRKVANSNKLETGNLELSLCQEKTQPKWKKGLLNLWP